MPNSGSPSAASAPLMSFMPGQTPPESCQPPPDPPSHSPSIARASTSRRSSSCKAPSSEPAWPVARMHTEIRDASRFVDTASREPLGMLLTLLTSSRPRPGPTMPRQQIGQALARTFNARRHDAGGDDGRLEQAQIIPGEIEDLGQLRDVGGGAEIHAGQPQDGLVNDAQIGLDRRPAAWHRAHARPDRSRR